MGDGGDSEESLVRPGAADTQPGPEKGKYSLLPIFVCVLFVKDFEAIQFNLKQELDDARYSIKKIVLHEQVLTFLSLAKLFSIFNAVR